MANRAYASIWLRELSEEILPERWESFLGTVPHSAKLPGFANLVVRAVDETETPILEQDMRSIAADTKTIAGLMREYLHGDCSYETRAFWDLWIYDPSSLRWEMAAQPLDLICYGEDFGEGQWQESGHIFADLGFEHFFTGHAGLLVSDGQDRPIPDHPDEQRFVSLMRQPQNLGVYREKTQENIRKLYDWMRKVEAALPAARTRLWSEGEENFEARMEEILAKH